MVNSLCHLRSIAAFSTLAGFGAFVLLCLAAVLVRRARRLAVWRLPRCVLVGFLALALVTTLLSDKTGTNGTDCAGAPMRNGARTSWMDEDAGSGSNGDAGRGDVARIDSVVRTTAGVDFLLHRTQSSVTRPEVVQLVGAPTYSSDAWRLFGVYTFPENVTDIPASVFFSDFGLSDPDSYFFKFVPFHEWDRDDDGLVDELDPEPLNPGADAHGANATWYDSVCSGVFERVAEGELTDARTFFLSNGERVRFRPGVNPDAYYFVEVTSVDGPIPIRFSADGPSNLGNPVLVARPGETILVPLLFGATYQVTSPAPFSLYDASGNVSIMPLEEDSEYGYRVCRTIGVEFATYDGWTLPAIAEDGRLHGVFSWSGGCCMRMGASGMRFQCSGCSCRGCTATGCYAYEGYVLRTPGPSCGCTGEDANEESPSHVETDSGASISLGFDKKAVIFEKAYFNGPNDYVPRRSTQTVLTLRANGGIRGGTLTMSTSRLSRLDLKLGQRPTGIKRLAPYEIYELVSTNEGLLASSEANDIEVSAVFTENGTQDGISVRTTLTSVQLELESVYAAPENPHTDRHVYGVGERVRFNVFPSLSDVLLKVVKHDTTDDMTFYDTFNRRLELPWEGGAIYTCAVTGGRADVEVKFADVIYRPVMDVVEPQEIITQAASGEDSFMIGEVAPGHLRTVNYIGPMNVSFQGIKVAELPCETELPATGYFATSDYTGARSHNYYASVGACFKIQAGNYWTVDRAGRGVPYQNWSAGRMVWKIPIGWLRILSDDDGPHMIGSGDFEYQRNPSSRQLLIGGREDAYLQIFSIEENGTATVEKFGFKLSRSRWSLTGSVVPVE